MRNDFLIKFKERDSLQTSEIASLPNLEDAVTLRSRFIARQTFRIRLVCGIVCTMLWS